MKTMYRRAAVAVLGGALLCSTAACGSEPAEAELTPVAAVQRAADKNEKLTSMAYTMSGRVPGEGDVEAEASMSLKPLAMRMTMRMEVEGEREEMEIRLTSGGLYLNGGEEAAAEMDGKSWLKFPVGALAEKGGENPLGGMAGQADQNPAAEAGSLTAAEDLKKVGDETIDGVGTAHYSGTLPFDEVRAALAEKPAAARENTEKTLKRYEDMGVDKLTMDMWIDQDDRTKQFRVRGASDKGPLDLTIKFAGYNKPVEIKAPPAAEVTDLEEMMKESAAG
ncbi:DUF1396 domain-containing protein [Streptomyces sp. NPDC087850]|uniref:DUF1396 domain-containing protein n=1 Tax=Streptomyces sp. NPDC087850 TaxID=3365809 RepID=UPI003807E49B